MLSLTLHITMAVRYCTVLEAPYSNSSGCLQQTAGLTLSCKGAQSSWPLTIVATVKRWSSTGPFQNTLIAPCNCLPWLCWGMPFSILSFWVRVKWMHAYLINHQNAIKECTALISPMLQMGGGKMNTHHSLIRVEHMWTALSTNFLFPQTVVEERVNTCWRDSNFCSNCHAWNTVHAFKDRLHLFNVAFILPMLGLHFKGHYLSLPSHS